MSDDRPEGTAEIPLSVIGKRLPGSAIQVLIAIGVHANKAHITPRLTDEQIADAVKIKPSRVPGYVRRLVDAGVLEVRDGVYRLIG
jgi:hypothetical protein